MKKLLVLSLVLAVASLANATYVITVAPACAGFTLGIDASDLIGVSDTAFALICKTTEGTITGGAVGSKLDTAAAINGNALPDLDGIIPAGMDGRYGLIGTYGTYATGNFFNGFNFAFAQGKSNATVYMWTMTEAGAQQVASVVLTPEPATMALLGLGGLFFARKK